MRRTLIALLFATSLQGRAQTLFTIGNDSVSVADFLYAYKKNNTGPDNAKTRQDYLELYIASKLKVKAAKARGLDTTAQFRADLAGLRAQVMPAYLNDPEALNRLTTEAFNRSQTDRSVAHIFIEANGTDTAAAFAKATEALAALRSGTPFDAVALRYSDDPAVASNKGAIGFVTVFTLPYNLEGLVYNTPVGNVAPLYRSSAGYHIIKAVAERPALGRVKAAQILLAFPPGATAIEQQALRKKADSLHTALQRGADFAVLAGQFSNDALTAGAGGLLPEVAVGQYDPVFEKAVFALPNDGAVSAPFVTAHGIHIVKRLGHVPVPAAATDAVLQTIRVRVQASDRIELARRQLAQQVLAGAGYQPLNAVMQAALQVRTAQELAGNAPADALPGGTVLFRLGGQPFTADQWLEWVRNNAETAASSGHNFDLLWERYLHTMAMEHYGQHLEQYNPEFARQMEELREGNLFFEIMQQEVWTPAQNDSVALRRYYEQNKQTYRWQRSANVVLFYAANKAVAEKLAAQVRQAPTRWQQWAARYATDVTTDTAHLEWSTVPGNATAKFAAGQVTSPEVNPADGSASFAYVVKLFPQPVQRSFEAARGAVINDYQAQREKEWVTQLKQQYPVRMIGAL